MFSTRLGTTWACRRQAGSLSRCLSSTNGLWHQNPLGLPISGTRPAPQMPTRSGSGPIQKRSIPHVKKVVAVASGKGGVGKSTVAANLALSLALGNSLRVGILDLDIFGPSIPKLMGLEDSEEPELTKGGHIIPLLNHGLQCMSMGFLLPKSPSGGTNPDTAVVWRGLMVQKAAQQLLFDVDWRGRDEGSPGLDVLVVDMPPGTGDVALTLGQLVKVDGAVIVSTPQDVALIDVRKGVSMFRKVSVPIIGVLLNMSHFTCPSCTTAHHLFGPLTSFHKTAAELSLNVLGEVPIAPAISLGGDAGVPAVLRNDKEAAEVKDIMRKVGDAVWKAVQ